MKKAKKEKIAFKILVPFMIIFTLVILFLIASLCNLVHKKTSKIIHKEALNKLNTVSQHFEISKGLILREMRNLSYFLGPMLGEKHHVHDIEEAIKRFKEFSEHYALQVLDKEGEIIIESLHGVIDIPPFTNKSILKSFFKGARADKIFLTNFNNNLAYEGITPIYKNGKIISFIRLFSQLGNYYCRQHKEHIEASIYLFIDNQVVATSENYTDSQNLFLPIKMPKITGEQKYGLIERVNIRGKKEMAGFLPLKGFDDTETIGHLMILMDTTLEKDLSASVLRFGIFYGIIGILILTFIGLFIAKSITQPIIALVEMARKVGKGDLTITTQVHSNDEIEELSDAFNTMTKNLKSTTVSKNYVDTIISSSMIDPLVVIDHDLTIQMINKAFSNMLGYNQAEITGRPISTVFADNHHLVLMKKNLKSRINEYATKSYETHLKTKDNRTIPVLFSESVMKDEEGTMINIVCTARDVTDKKRVEKQLHEKKEYLNRIWDSMQAGIIIINRKTGRIFDANPKAIKMIGAPKKEVIDSFYQKYISYSENVSGCEPQFAAKIKNFECKLIKANGGRIPILISTAPIVLNNCEYTLENFIDITERERAKKAMKQSAIIKAERQRLFSVLEVLPAFTFLRSSDYSIPFANRRFQKIFGNPEGKRCYEIMFKRNDPCKDKECIYSCAFSVGNSSQIMHYPDGKVYEIYCKPFFDIDNTQMILTMGIDITERIKVEKAKKEAEAKLKDQRARSILYDRLRSLGEMATGIAHELNQPLMGVRGLAEHILLGLKRGWKISDQDLQDKIRLIIEQTDRMSHVIEHTRMFAGGAVNNKLLPVQVNEVIKSSMSLIGTQLRNRGLTVEFDLADNLPTIFVNPFSLEEVIVNLINNAKDAYIDEKNPQCPKTLPKIFLRTNQKTIDAHTFVNIEIVDHGKGIPQELMSNIFTPFFTTKPPDKGTGLGLSISKSIIEDFNGKIQIKSTAGLGTIISIFLPAMIQCAEEKL
ncbi:MAG: PAS domain S-box protein [bacterium]